MVLALLLDAPVAAKPNAVLLLADCDPCLLPSGLLPPLLALLPRGVRFPVPLLRGDLERGVEAFLLVDGVL